MAKKRSFAESAFKRYTDPRWNYNPKDGHGTVSEWQDAWNYRMGTEEAKAALGGDDPLSILGLTAMPSSKADLQKAYRAILIKNQEWHRQDASPEDQAKLRKVIAAKTKLESRYA
jgi:hypothetical protein